MEIHLDWLLRLAWIAGTLPILLASLPSSSLNSFHQLLLGFAKRGKIMQLSSSSSSFHKFTVPQRFFLHFYLLGVVWTTFLLIVTWHYAYKMTLLGSGSLIYSVASAHMAGGSRMLPFYKSGFSNTELNYRVWLSVFMLLLMEMHVLRRLYETVYVLKYSPSARMHVFGYLTGLFFYTAAPLSLCHFCIFEALNVAEYRAIEMNVKNEEISPIDFDWWGYMTPILQLGWCQWAGAAIFACGWVHQQRCHAILGSLRKQRRQVDEYLIPHGDWFEMVSSPHYLAEMIIYLGLLVASGGNDLTIWLLNLFVVANLAFAAAETQRWYLQKFEDYPRNRRAILPFVY
ncbi:polyprenol reductase 2 isoform X2 [Ricinus communis]|uniref:Dfg10 protein, putative n=2 Tax=Ricinus communis TaxID=3988 RepID=B9SZU7_RICCO|nr:polyprenol reductase 2 isoform X2 [Ricinus communis]EEF30870.1 dfg10 protein, putative [Ricinus communis]|eukprot:XP_002531516.1 polyprenol reductase 2 isoform X1 [Ricinus communis]